MGEFAGRVIFYLLEIFTDERVGRRVIYYLFEIFQNELAWASSLTIACRSMDSEVSCLVLGS